MFCRSLCINTLLLTASAFLWTVAHSSLFLTIYAMAFGFSFGGTITLLLLLARSYYTMSTRFFKSIATLALCMSPGCVLGPVFAASVLDFMDELRFAGVVNSLPIFIAYAIVFADRFCCGVSVKRARDNHNSTGDQPTPDLVATV